MLRRVRLTPADFSTTLVSPLAWGRRRAVAAASTVAAVSIGQLLINQAPVPQLSVLVMVYALAAYAGSPPSRDWP